MSSGLIATSESSRASRSPQLSVSMRYCLRDSSDAPAHDTRLQLAVLARHAGDERRDERRRHHALARVDELEQHEVGEQHAPVPAEAAQHPLPVERGALAQQQVGDVGAVVAVLLHHERLRPDHLLRRHQARLDAEHAGRTGVGEPLVVDHRDAVAGAVDHVEAVVALLGLGEPVGESDLRLPAELAQHFERPVAAVARHEQIEVLGRARDAGVRREGERAAHQVRHAARIEARERRAVGRVGACGRRLLDRYDLLRRAGVCHAFRWSNGCASAETRARSRARNAFLRGARQNLQSACWR